MKNSFSVISFPPCFLWASEKSVYHLLSISTIRKDPEVLNVCSSQPSKSAWPHWKTQKQQNISSLTFFFPAFSKMQPKHLLEGWRSASLTWVIIKILEFHATTWLSESCSTDGWQHCERGTFGSLLANFSTVIPYDVCIAPTPSLVRSVAFWQCELCECPVSYVFSPRLHSSTQMTANPYRALLLWVTLLISCFVLNSCLL